jgi:hypothetical protein
MISSDPHGEPNLLTRGEGWDSDAGRIVEFLPNGQGLDVRRVSGTTAVWSSTAARTVTQCVIWHTILMMIGNQLDPADWLRDPTMS